MAKFDNRILTPIQGSTQSKIEKAKQSKIVDFCYYLLNVIKFASTEAITLSGTHCDPKMTVKYS